jgi:hypothetical protein
MAFSRSFNCFSYLVPKFGGVLEWSTWRRIFTESLGITYFANKSNKLLLHALKAHDDGNFQRSFKLNSSLGVAASIMSWSNSAWVLYEVLPVISQLLSLKSPSLIKSNQHLSLIYLPTLISPYYHSLDLVVSPSKTHFYFSGSER